MKGGLVADKSDPQGRDKHLQGMGKMYQSFRGRTEMCLEYEDALDASISTGGKPQSRPLLLLRNDSSPAQDLTVG